jgi:signal transduction histidine kinase
MNPGPKGLMGSLRFRLLAATVLGVSLAMVLAGVVLNGLFHEHVMRQFEKGLAQQLDQVTARLSADAQGQPLIDAQSLSDPRWQRPYSGLYWQLDDVTPTAVRQGVLRSRSLWDTQLTLPVDELRDGEIHAHELSGPGDSRLRVLERTVRPEMFADAKVRWRLSVAADLKDTHEAVTGFQRVLAVSLVVLLLLLLAAAWAQVALGLRPLLVLQQGLNTLREGRTPRLTGNFPSEVQPLVDNFNGVLDRNDEVVGRARTQAGNLAHALKTPLTVLDQAARQTDTAGLAPLVREQVQLARRHIDWHLARARMAASSGVPGQRVPVVHTLQGLVRVMQRVHAERQLTITLDESDERVQFAGEAQDLQEMLGNVLDNACQWAHKGSARDGCSFKCSAWRTGKCHDGHVPRRNRRRRSGHARRADAPCSGAWCAPGRIGAWQRPGLGDRAGSGGGVRGRAATANPGKRPGFGGDADFACDSGHTDD